MSPADYLDYRSSSSFDGLAAVSRNPVRLTGDGTPEQAQAAQVSGNFFSRAWRERDRRPHISARRRRARPARAGGRKRSAVGASIWPRGGLIGRTITISDQPVEVVGVMPASFRFEERVDIWLLGDRGLPRFTSIQNLAQNRDVHMLTVVGRLSAGRIAV